MLDYKTGLSIYTQLRDISVQILKANGCLEGPYQPVTRTKRWDNATHPTGIIYHYTGGVSGLNSMKWGNDPTYKNTVCSWHVLIFDRIPPGSIGDLWVKMADKDMRHLFPVPAIIMSEWKWATWHGNWTNGRCLGIENRNAGYSQDAAGLAKLGKGGILIKGRLWEPFTREQIVANVNMGHLIYAWNNLALDPQWILPHSAVWAEKSDTGPMFPIHLVRKHVFTGLAATVEEEDWLAQYDMAPDTNEDDDASWEFPFEKKDPEDKRPTFTTDVRDTGKQVVPWVNPAEGVVATMSDDDVATCLYAMGYPCGPEMPTSNQLNEQVRIFQHSTQAYANPKGINKPEWVLTVDGVVGSKTQEAIQRRMQQLHIVSPPR